MVRIASRGECRRAMRRRRINQIYDPVMSVQTAATKADRLVYILVANRPLRYKKGQSRIIYIGTTSKGVRRIAASASGHISTAPERDSGIRRIDAYVVWAGSKRGKQTHKGVSHWLLLERALLISFCDQYDSPPRLNGT